MYDNTPHTPQGSIHEGDACGLSRSSAVAWQAAQARAARSPFSNTGSKPHDAEDAPAFVDYLKFTLKGLRVVADKLHAEDEKRDRHDGLDDVRQVLREHAAGGWDVTRAEQDATRKLLASLDPIDVRDLAPLDGLALDRAIGTVARIMVQACTSTLVFGDFTGKGRDGYRDHLKIFTHTGTECGFIAFGGNRESVHVNLTGQACERMDIEALCMMLDGVEHKIGRIDAAWDDLAGRYGTPHGSLENYRHGGFTPERGVRSEKVTFIDDCGTGKGSTFNLGDRASRMFRHYEKGRQLGDKSSPWCRFEVQYMGSAFDLTTADIRNPGKLLLQYPDLDFLPVIGTGDHTARIRREAEIATDRVVEWMHMVAGPVLTLLVESIGVGLACELLENHKTPRRMKHLGNSRTQLAELVGDALLDSRKHRPIARTSRYLSAEQRDRHHEHQAAA
jgi:phage replication initiation protein